MRKVVNKSEVARLWANQSQDEARTPGNGSFYFNGRVIYSYGRHFPIAVHYRDVILFTTRGYSNTTSKHIGEARYAANKTGKKVVCVPNPLDGYSSNLAEMTREMNNWIEQVKHKRNRILQYRAEGAINAARQIADYSEVVGEAMPFEVAATVNFLLNNSVETIISELRK